MKRPYKMLYDNYSNSWNRITDSSAADVFANAVVTPKGVRPAFSMYENTTTPIRPLDKNITVGPDNYAYTKKLVDTANNTRTWRSNVADALHGIGEGAMLASNFMTPEIYPLVYPAYAASKSAVYGALTSNAPAMQYLRYPIGKVIYGPKAQFPTLYRKLHGLPPKPENDIVQISNPNPRFKFVSTGEESPVITNFTFDAPVRAHSRGNWDGDMVMAMNGRKTLLGKNVISTEPSDLFTYGDNIKLNKNDVTIIAGDNDVISSAEKYGYKYATSPELQETYRAGLAPESNNRFNLLKNDHYQYSKDVELLARKLFGSPTKKDVDFMNFVLQPKIKGKVYEPKQLFDLIRDGVEPFGDAFGNALYRGYFLDPERWVNLLYDPASPVENTFRKQMGIDLKRK